MPGCGEPFRQPLAWLPVARDGADPDEIAKQSREQLSLYDTLTWYDGTAERIEASRDAFGAVLADGRSAEGRRVLFATVVSDTLPGARRRPR
ncbi:MAG: hypothetical protein EOQ57_20915 [Mesorhizobium sp.]|nr:hypothetical protein [Mesorhizobium sp.]RWB98678.1 MAG: hypothetical protein EOQ57_20915 [Mesorhizobium sp.]